MTKKISQIQEYAVFATGLVPSVMLNAAVKRGAIPAAFDLLNLLLLLIIPFIVVPLLYWKVKQIESNPAWMLTLMGILGWCSGSWLVSRLVSS